MNTFMYIDYVFITLLAAFKVEPVLTVSTILFLFAVPTINTLQVFRALKKNASDIQFKFKITKLVYPVFIYLMASFIWVVYFIIFLYAILVFCNDFYSAGITALIIYIAPIIIRFIVRKYLASLEPYSRKENRIVAGIYILMIFGLFSLGGLLGKIDSYINNLDSIKKGKTQEQAYFSCKTNVNQDIIKHLVARKPKCRDINVEMAQKLADDIVTSYDNCAKRFPKNKKIQFNNFISQIGNEHGKKYFDLKGYVDKIKQECK